ncbi:MAG: hypothetical protein QOK04_797 [Solirubrobacteraceae bacterium]|jgi:hypothetical protein|nr:hypothetical protein [Solirubrobacteraceae bacterium]
MPEQSHIYNAKPPPRAPQGATGGAKPAAEAAMSIASSTRARLAAAIEANYIRDVLR